MPDLNAELHATLKSMLNAISAGSGQTDAGESLADLLRRIDALGVEMGDACPPMLQHYLSKRSYVKASAFLEGRDETTQANC